MALFQEALAKQGFPPAHVIAWADLLAEKIALSREVPPGAIVRIESPGKDFEVERAILAAGAEVPDAEGFERLSPRQVRALTFEKGRILALRQWYLGFCRTLQNIEEQLADRPLHRRMNAPADIAVMFDKPACQARLQAAGIHVPRALGVPRSYSELIETMRRAGCYRVFVKPAHGSSASGVVAYQTDGKERHQATTTVEMVREQGRLRLYNSRQIRTCRDQGEIAELIEALCCCRVLVEQWLPKAGHAGRIFDLRVVVIGGRARHVVARSSHTTLTNLHLLNTRGDVEAIQERMGRHWDAAMETCEQTLRCFPDSHYAGLDLLITPDFQSHAILEVNAFGDLLPGLCHEGETTYEAEIREKIQGKREKNPTP